MGLVQKAFSDIITFSRSSNATRVGPTGRVEYAPHNLQVRSQEFENAIWTKAGASITANATAAPDGTVTAEKLVEDSSSGGHQTYQIGLTVVAQSYTASVYAKAAERTNIWLALFNGTSNGGVYFNLANGTAGGLGTDVTAASITPAGNGWYRCSITRTMVASANAGINIQLADSTPSISYVGNGSSGVFIWGAQLSVGPYALDYTPTTSAAVYGPRFDYDPVTLAARGLLVEEQRVNVYTYSEQFDNVAWTKGGSSITANAGTAPDGTVTADKIVEDSGTTAHVAYQTPTVSAVAYTLSVFAKAAERTQVVLDFTGGSNNAIFNLSAGTVVSSTGSGLTAAIQDFGNGWYRCSITQTQSAGTIYPSIGPASGGNRIYTGNGSSGILIWGAQLEAGSFATSLIPTLASTVTRSADVASVNTLSPWFNNTEGTLFVDSSSQATAYSAALYTDISNYISFLNGTAGAAYEVVVAGSTQASIGTRGLSTKVAGAYKANDFAVSVNGGVAATDTSGTVPTITDRLQLGSFPSVGFYINGYLRRVAFFPRRLSNAELAALTS